MDPTKLKGITEWKMPSCIKDVRSFLGFANFYRHFIVDYSSLARPLIDLMKKGCIFEWGDVEQAAFNQLKPKFISTPILQIPDKTAAFSIATDTSLYATRATLLQKDSNGDWLPCSFLSQSFNPTECNYQIYNHELLAIVRALKAWRHYLLVSHPVLRTSFTCPSVLSARHIKTHYHFQDSLDSLCVHLPPARSVPFPLCCSTTYSVSYSSLVHPCMFDRSSCMVLPYVP